MQGGQLMEKKKYNQYLESQKVPSVEPEKVVEEEPVVEDESFDEEFMSQHPDRFIDRGLPQEVRQRYYWKGWCVHEQTK